jgi:hypothetical protein
MISPSITGIAILASLGLVFGAYFYGVTTTEQRMNLEREKDISEQVVKNQELVTKLQEKKNEADTVVDQLLSTNRVIRVQVPTSCPKAYSPSDTIARTESLSDGVQKVFNDFTERMAELTAEADRTVNECRLLQEWSTSLESQP